MFQLGLRRPFLARDFSQKPRAGSRINVSMCPRSGGALTVAFGWLSVMFVNVPIGIAAALLSQRFLPKTEGWLKNQRLDVPGAITVTLGTILLVFGLTNAATSGFDSWGTIVPLGLSVVGLT